MSSEVDAQIERAREMLQRVGADYRGTSRRLRRRATSVGQRMALAAVIDAAILLTAAVVGATVMPLGIMGVLAVLLLVVAATLAVALAPAGRAPSERKLREVELRALPGQTERWLETQRPQLPAPARMLVDRIGSRLDVLSPQLARLNEGAEDALEVRRLVGEQLPAFLTDYARVPAPLRVVARHGKTPDAELVDGLKLIEREIAEMTERLAQGDLDRLQTRGRFLDLKYNETAGE